MINLHLGDGEKALNEMDENHYDLAIIDCPYGIGENGNNISRHYSQKKYKKSDWDNKPPPPEYFDLLKIKTKNQIIWGANHFIDNFPFMCNSSCWLFWDKDRYGDFADGELAWTSFKTAVRKFKFTWDGFRKQIPENRIHHTQKPAALYKWLLKNYGFNKDGSKRTIVDTHSGSLSIGIACSDMGFNLDAWEIDEDYFNAAVKRLYNHVSQLNAFIERPEILVNGVPINEYVDVYIRSQIKG